MHSAYLLQHHDVGICIRTARWLILVVEEKFDTGKQGRKKNVKEHGFSTSLLDIGKIARDATAFLLRYAFGIRIKVKSMGKVHHSVFQISGHSSRSTSCNHLQNFMMWPKLHPLSRSVL
jgi:hypothetical protein